MSEGGVGLAAVLRDCLLAEGGGAGSSLHSWRCEHPDLYGTCTCVEETAAELVAVVLDHLAAKASEAAVVEAVVRAIVAVDDVAYADGLDSATAQDAATAALTAFVRALRGPQALQDAPTPPPGTVIRYEVSERREDRR